MRGGAVEKVAMSRHPEALVLMDLPAGSGRSALRAALMAMRLVPSDLPQEPAARAAMLARMADAPQGLAFIDVSADGRATTSKLLELDARLPRGPVRQRITLTRLRPGGGAGHVSEADRRWVQRLGFTDLFAEFDPADCEGNLRHAVDGVARQLGLSPLSPADLARYARIMNGERDPASPRAVVRSLCGLSAEALAGLLSVSLNIADRTYHLKSYPHCFVGAEAVAWLSRRLRCARAEAVATGQALAALGLLVHVVHEHPFLDDNLFYRLATSTAADAVDLGEALARLTGPDGPPTADRTYLGRTYDRCWIGAEAVDRLVQWRGIARHDAWIVLHRLMQFGLVAHVAQARPVIDGHYFYRFIGMPAGGVH